MGLQDKEANGHWRVGLREKGMVAREHLRKPDHVAVTLPHFLPVDGDHIVMQPIPGWNVLIADSTLRDLAFVVGEHEVHSAAVDVEFNAKVFSAHGGAFDMPAGETLTPGALPPHDMFGGRGLPKCEVLPVVLLVLAVEIAGSFKQIIQDA